MAVLPRDRDHIIVNAPSEGTAYARRGGGGGTVGLPQRNRSKHSAHLMERAEQAASDGAEWIGSRDSEVAEGEPGYYLAFSMPKDEASSIDAVADGTRKVELVAVQNAAEGETVLGTVFVPEGKGDYFTKKLKAYSNPDEDRRDKQGQIIGPKNEELISRVVDIQIGSARGIFTDGLSYFPKTDEYVWWEVWVRSERVGQVRSVAAKLSLNVRPEVLRFPERDVLLVFGCEQDINSLMRNSDGVAELRLSSDTPAMFSEMNAYEQLEWANDLTGRISAALPEAPYVTIFDSGANNAHPLISPALSNSDQHTVNDDWGVGDSPGWHGHGTAMSGAVLYPALDAALASTEDVVFSFHLETVKILPSSGPENDQYSYGAITESAVDLVETAEPQRTRVFCMATSSNIQIRRGRPSSWSAAVDKLAYGQRLIVLSAGNVRNAISATEYPDRNDIEPVESPGQSWNALVVGGYTQRTNITDPTLAGWSPLAPVGGLAPTTRTGVSWDSEWANKPDIVFEAGNLAHDGTNTADPVSDLQLVTTHYRPQIRLFQSFGDTSAATAQAANLCGVLRANYPALRSETIRGLVVHSAEWTPAMQDELNAANVQADRLTVLRRYGWGVPDQSRAIFSAANAPTIIIEDQIVPFTEDAKMNELRLHRLPWPSEILLELGEQPVELRVTLSYFVEPNPAERGWTRKHRYASHGLRFKLKRPLETEDQFQRRINKAASFDYEVGEGSEVDDQWSVKERVRDKGSLHSDIWKGTAAELANRSTLAVFPVGGWWKEKRKLGRCGSPVYYSLLVSISTEAEVDLHTVISNQLAVEVAVG